VAASFAHILELGPNVSLLYSRRGIMVAIFSQFAIDITGFIMCLYEPSLQDFFESSIYRFLSAADILENMIFTSLLAFFGLKIIRR
jgi:hypothetical protein